MEKAISETIVDVKFNMRNEKHGIIPTTIKEGLDDTTFDIVADEELDPIEESKSLKNLDVDVSRTPETRETSGKGDRSAASRLDFELAAMLRTS